MEKILTIVVPTYNMEKYLDKCLTSLVIENIELMKQLEVLVINDGSKDQSSEIAHGYETKWPDTFKVIDKENGNYGSCINRGLKEATGKYIKVLDADDYFDTKSFQNYISILTKIDVDLVITDYNVVNENEIITNQCRCKMERMRVYNADSVINKDIFNLTQMHAFTYKNDVFNGLNYHQTEGISYTDQEWIFTPMINVNKIIYINQVVYNYLMGRAGQTMNPDIVQKSIMHTEKSAISMIIAYNKNKNSLSDCKEKFLHNKLLNRLNYIYRRYLLESTFLDLNDLLTFDNNIKKISQEFYTDLSNEIPTSRFPVKYIKLWRATKYTKRGVIDIIIISVYKLLNCI